MERTFRIFISATKQTLEFEREALINNLLLQGCIPITMEYFINSNNISTLYACTSAIDKSDAVILILKSKYGTNVDYKDVEKSFPNGCPLKNICNSCSGECHLSYTHFEYLYAKLKKKIIYVISNQGEVTEEIKEFYEETQSNGCYNVYNDDSSFIATSITAISKIIQDCRADNNLGLVPATIVKELPCLQQRVDFLESNFYNGFVPQKNYMGCIMAKKTEDLIFYVYKELRLKSARTGFDFSIHINIGDKSNITLSSKFVEAHAYVKYKTRDKFTPFYECQINEKSYGHEYLNCHIEFLKQNNIRLPIKKDDMVGILYTYKINKFLYGDEIGRQISPFFETTLVELMYEKNKSNFSFDCFEKIENNLIDVEGLDSRKIRPSRISFLREVLSVAELRDYILNTYNIGEMTEYEIKKIVVPEFFDEAKHRRLSHFYVKWSD